MPPRAFALGMHHQAQAARGRVQRNRIIWIKTTAIAPTSRSMETGLARSSGNASHAIAYPTPASTQVQPANR